MINKKEFWGFLILIIGLVLLLSNFHFLDYSVRRFLRDLWPLIIIAIGVAMILRHFGKGSETSGEGQQIPPGNLYTGSISKTFGDIRADLRNLDIDGFSGSTTFGDNTVNLSGGKLKSGVNRIRVTCIFGDITIVVPANIEALAYGSSTFGDVYIFGKTDTGMSSRLQNQTDGYETAASKVHITTGTTFGDIKVIRA